MTKGIICKVIQINTAGFYSQTANMNHSEGDLVFVNKIQQCSNKIPSFMCPMWPMRAGYHKWLRLQDEINVGNFRADV